MWAMCPAFHPRSTGSIFTKILPNGTYLVIDDCSDILSPVVQGTLPWQPILGSKLTNSAYSPLFTALAFQNGVECHNNDFKKFISMI